MLKSKLQEMCHKKGWDPPEYETTKEGQDHDPRFRSKVNVNGQTFLSQAVSRSSKHSQNDAAKLALDYFSSSSSSPSPPPPPPLSPINNSSSRSCSGVNGNGGLFSGGELAMIEQKLNQAIENNGSNGVAAVPKNDDRFRDASRGTTESNLNHGGVMHVQLPAISQSPHENGLNGVAAVTMNDDKFREVQSLCKNHLQIYAQKNKLPLPVYTCERIGPPHASRFKCKVTINGQTYESLDLSYTTLKEAEHAAARVALMSLPSDEVKEDESGYKNLLQELAQKEGYQLPTYTTCKSGEAHMPIFVSTVEIEGESFTGQEARSKKQAEMSAARVAYTAIRLRNSNEASGHHSPAGQGKESPLCSSSGLLPQLAAYFQQNVQPKVLLPSETAEENWSAESSSKPQVTFPVPEKSFPLADGVSSAPGPSPSKQDSSSPLADSPTSLVINSSIKRLVEMSALCRKGIVVHACETNVAYPAGCTLSPLSNDSWTVANYIPSSSQ